MRRPVPSLTAATFDKLKFPIFMHIKPPDDLGLAQLIPTVWWKYATKVSYACSSWGQHSPLFLHNRKSENSHFTVLKNKPQSYKGNKKKSKWNIGLFCLRYMWTATFYGFHGTAFRKLICISRSTSHMSELEVMCLIILWGYKWLEKNGILCLCSVNCLLQTQNSSILVKCLCFNCTPMCKGLWDRIGIFHTEKNQPNKNNGIFHQYIRLTMRSHHWQWYTELCKLD